MRTASYGDSVIPYVYVYYETVYYNSETVSENGRPSFELI